MEDTTKSNGAHYPTIYVQVETRRPGCAEQSDQMVTVKFECPDGYVITQVYTLSTSIRSLKECLSHLVDLGVDTLLLVHSGLFLADDQLTLDQLGAKVNGTLSLLLTTTYPLMYPIRIKHTTLPPLPDVITVRVRARKLLAYFLSIKITVITTILLFVAILKSYFNQWRREGVGYGSA